jgi:hypothetical protein
MPFHRWLIALTLSSLCACAEDHYGHGRERSPVEQQPTEPTSTPIAVVSAGAQEPPPAIIEPPPLEDEVCAIRTFDMRAPEGDILTIAPCSFRFVKWPGPIYPRYTEVQVGERALPFAAMSDGWTVSGDTMVITLLGAACSDADTGSPITVSFKCMFAIAE